MSMILSPYRFAPAGDPYWSNVVLLCHFDGTDGQTTTVDSSSHAHSLTMAGGTLSAANPKFGSTSLALSAIWSEVVMDDSDDWYFGDGEFTLEAFVVFTSDPGLGERDIVDQIRGNVDGALAIGWNFKVDGGELRFEYSTNGSDSHVIGAAWTPALNTQYHVAVDHDTSDVLRIYIDGVVHASATVSAAFFDAPALLRIGNNAWNGNAFYPGYIDELRITKGVARYAGAFTPPTAAFHDS